MRTWFAATTGCAGAIVLLIITSPGATTFADARDSADGAAVGDHGGWLRRDCEARRGTPEQCRCFESSIRTKLSQSQLDYLSDVAPDVADPGMGLVLFSKTKSQGRAWLGYARSLLDCGVGQAPTVATAAPHVMTGDYILASEATLRARPDASSEVIRTLVRQTDVHVIGEEPSHGWVRVQLGREEGYLGLNDFVGSMRVTP